MVRIEKMSNEEKSQEMYKKFVSAIQEEEKKNQSSGEEEKFCIPNSSNTTGIKINDYSKCNNILAYSFDNMNIKMTIKKIKMNTKKSYDLCNRKFEHVLLNGSRYFINRNEIHS